VTTPASPALAGLAVNPDQPTRLGIVPPLFHQAKKELALGRQRFAMLGFLALIRICHLQLLKDQSRVATTVCCNHR
jgi:hypothetical protein